MEQWNADTMQMKIAHIFSQHYDLIHYEVISFSFSNPTFLSKASSHAGQWKELQLPN